MTLLNILQKQHNPNSSPQSAGLVDPAAPQSNAVRDIQQQRNAQHRSDGFQMRLKPRTDIKSEREKSAGELEGVVPEAEFLEIEQRSTSWITIAFLILTSLFFALPAIAQMFGILPQSSAPLFAVLGMICLSFLWVNVRLQSRKIMAAAKQGEQFRNQQLAQRLEAFEDKSWEIRESEEIHRSLAETFDDIVIDRQEDNSLSFTSTAFHTYFDETHTFPSFENPIPSAVETVGRDVQIQTKLGKRWFARADLVVRDTKSGKTVKRTVARDITERKNYERSLTKALTKAQIASEAKSRFLAMVSHEIRTPLNGVVGMAALLQDTELQPVQRDYLAAIAKSGQSLSDLIEDLLDSAQIEAGQLSLSARPTHLSRLVEDVADVLAPRAADKQLDIATYIDPTLPERVAVDAGRLRQVLLNLAGNSTKFTAAGGVSITAVMVAENRHDQCHVAVEFAITDTGPGLSKQDQSRIFDEFTQTDAGATREFGGAGLGLSISKNIVSLMGSHIDVQSKVGKGSRFSFIVQLPIVGTSKNLSTLEKDAAVNATETVAVIVNNSPARKALVQTISSQGRRVETFDSLAAFYSRPTVGGAKTSVVVELTNQSEEEKAAVELRDVLGNESRMYILGGANDRQSFPKFVKAGFDGWFTWPIRSSTLQKVLEQTGIKEDVVAHFPQQPDPIENNQTALHVLLAEDNPINAMLGKSLLGKLGHSVVHVEDGQQAVNYVAGLTDWPDIIFMDLHMPHMGGVEAIKAIRKLEKTSNQPKTPIIVLSADGQAKARHEAIDSGANDFLTKPLNLEAMGKILKNHGHALIKR